MKLGQIAFVRMINCEVKRISVEFEKYNIKSSEFHDCQKYDDDFGCTTNRTNVSDLGFSG
jgi:hypothetical protein